MRISDDRLDHSFGRQPRSWSAVGHSAAPLRAMLSGVETILFLVAVHAAQGCGGGYLIEQNVTVPVDVQRVFSASGPGFVMNRAIILGVLCVPKGEPVVFHHEQAIQHSSCEKYKGFEDDVSGTAYAFRPSSYELEQLDASSRGILACGETGPVKDANVDGDVFDYYYDHRVDPLRQLAVGSSKGECVSSSHYVVNITLALK